MSRNFIERLSELPQNLANHIMLTVVALLIGVALSLPLAIWLVKVRALRYPILTGAGVIQTIPSLALLALMVPLLDKTAGLGMGLAAFGFFPAMFALTLYSILPILRNTVTGILGVDPVLTEAARGVGMTSWQSLWKVELPIAAPVIIAGVRTATVWVVGIATLSTPVGQRSLGNYIFTGLQTRNWTMLLFGVVSAASLAILLDTLIGGIQKATEERRRVMGWTCAGALLLVCAVGLVSPRLVDWVRSTQRTMITADDDVGRDGAAPVTTLIRIGSKTFTEQYILATLIELELRDADFQTERHDSLGSIVAFSALANDEIDVYVDYTGTIWANSLRRDDVPPPWRVESILSGWLADTYGMRTLGTLGFENAYALTMRREHAEELGIRGIDDLAPHTPDMTVGGDYEFFGRPEWSQMRDAYGLNFRARTSYDSTLMYEALAKGEVDVISAFSTDGRIAAYDLLVLDDPRHVIPPYDAVVLLAPGVADEERLIESLQDIVGAIDADLMRAANLMVDRDENRTTVAEAAEWLHAQILDEAANDS
jgi:osmoprotectant transport system permease protein